MDQTQYLDRIKGCMFGGAVGDALGYPVEFASEEDIREHYPNGRIEKYDIDSEEGMALISDDTQMSLFTAGGLLNAVTDFWVNRTLESPCSYVFKTLLDWYKTQTMEQERYFYDRTENSCSWLMEVPDLWARRAPGSTCLSALRKRQVHFPEDGDFINDPLNDSKGCGGIMRVAPVALWYNEANSILDVDRDAAQIAAITHSHPLGFLSAAALAHILHRLVYYKADFTLEEAIRDAEKLLPDAFEGMVDPAWIESLNAGMEEAIEKSQNNRSDLENIRTLGQGWVAEETLSIALYCALRHQNDFSGGVIAAVNHRGDSDSTGAVAGNLLGAMCGYDAIEDKWKQNLELSGVVLEMAEDLCFGARILASGAYNEAWEQKYVKMHRMREVMNQNRI